MSSVAAGMAIASAVAAVASATVAGVQSYNAAKTQQAQNEFNAAQELEAEKQAHQEESLNASQRYRAIRHEMATGQNILAGSGNIGTSAESALRGGYFNMSEDLSALRYRYQSEALGHKTAALNYKYNANVAKHNKNMGVLASSIKVTGAATKGMTDLYAGGYVG